MILYGTKPYEILFSSHLVDEFSKSPDYCCELKMNGWRLMLCSDEKGDCIGYQSHGERMSYLNLMNVKLPPNTEIECEWVDRRTVNHKDIVYPFNILKHEGKVCELKDCQRRILLEQLFPEDITLGGLTFKLIPRYQTDFRKIYTSMRDNNLIEGLVIKQLSADLEYSYDKLRKSSTQIKVKK